MTARMTVTAESAMFSAQNILAVTVEMKMVLKSLFIVQCAVVAEAWNMHGGILVRLNFARNSIFQSCNFVTLSIATEYSFTLGQSD